MAGLLLYGLEQERTDKVSGGTTGGGRPGRVKVVGRRLLVLWSRVGFSFLSGSTGKANSGFQSFRE